jgi:hypothetical protein
VPASNSVILQDITLKGNDGNNKALVSVSGNLTMKDGSRITGNTSSVYSSGGGVNIDAATGSFTMEGGSIDLNNVLATSGNVYGCGVYVTNGTFTMKGGVIENNIIGETDATNSVMGGGVYVAANATFTMNDGIIRNNTAITAHSSQYCFGGGVYTLGAFTMAGGTILGNKAGKGGGVGIGSNAKASFTMTGGAIAGNKAIKQGAGVFQFATNATGKFEKTGGTIYGNGNDAGDNANKAIEDGITVHAIEIGNTTPSAYCDSTHSTGDTLSFYNGTKVGSWSP